jgi:hypothetical protein
LFLWGVVGVLTLGGKMRSWANLVLKNPTKGGAQCLKANTAKFQLSLGTLKEANRNFVGLHLLNETGIKNLHLPPT